MIRSSHSCKDPEHGMWGRDQIVQSSWSKEKFGMFKKERVTFVGAQ